MTLLLFNRTRCKRILLRVSEKGPDRPSFILIYIKKKLSRPALLPCVAWFASASGAASNIDNPAARF
jgi:hypothetical protein